MRTEASSCPEILHWFFCSKTQESEVPINQSALRQSIVFALAQHSASSVTQLAKELDYLRPSVSRVLSHLKTEGVVKQEGGIWQLTEHGYQIVKGIQTKEEVYAAQIQPLLLKIAKIVKQYDIPFVSACEVDGWLRIERHHVNACSELYCAYGELTGWSDETL